MFQFQRGGDHDSSESWIVTINRKYFPRSKRSWPKEVTLGSVKLAHRLVDTVFELYPQSYYKNDPYVLAEAKRLIQSSMMFEELVQERQAYHVREQQSGDYLVVIGEEITRWHTIQRASAYASDRLKQIWKFGLQLERRAVFHRGSIENPFHALEVNEFGHATVVPSR
jgi:hypothetical protein